MSRFRVCFCLFLGLLFALTGCSSHSSHTADIDAHVHRLHHLNAVASSVLVAGTGICGDRTDYYLGLDNLVWDQGGAAWEQAYATNHGLDQQFIIQQVISGSPAEKSGLLVGDRIVALNGEAVQPGMRSYIGFKKKLRDTVKTGAPLTFDIQRGGGSQTITVTPEKRCLGQVIMSNSVGVDAKTDGDVIEISKGLMDFVVSDDELAWVVGHELGHVVLDHSGQKAAAKTVGSILDIATLSTGLFADPLSDIYTEEFNLQADRLAVFFVELAGYDASRGAPFLRRAKAEASLLNTYAKDHPVIEARLAALQQVVDGVKAREAQNQPLTITQSEVLKD